MSHVSACSVDTPIDSGHLNRQPIFPVSSFATYLIGFIILIVGLAFGAYLLNVPTSWVVVGIVILLGIGVLMATSRTRPRDPPPPGSGPQPPAG
jgi:hypothetical protein